MWRVWCWIRGPRIASVAREVGLGESVVGRWVKLERERRQAAAQGRPDPREMEAEITGIASAGAPAGEGERVLGKSQTPSSPPCTTTPALLN